MQRTRMNARHMRLRCGFASSGVGCRWYCCYFWGDAPREIPISSSGAGNPIPSITSLSPSSVNAGGASFTLTVNGTNFVPAAVVQWKGVIRTTTFVSSTQLAVTVTGADIASPGTADGRRSQFRAWRGNFQHRDIHDRQRSTSHFGALAFHHSCGQRTVYADGDRHGLPGALDHPVERERSIDNLRQQHAAFCAHSAWRTSPLRVPAQVTVTKSRPEWRHFERGAFCDHCRAEPGTGNHVNRTDECCNGAHRPRPDSERHGPGSRIGRAVEWGQSSHPREEQHPAAFCSTARGQCSDRERTGERAESRSWRPVRCAERVRGSAGSKCHRSDRPAQRGRRFSRSK